MGAEVTFFSGMIFGVDKDCIVRARGHAGFATDADGFIEVHNAIRPFEHGSGWTGSHTRCMSTLVTTRDLVRTANLWKGANVDVLDVSARDR